MPYFNKVHIPTDDRNIEYVIVIRDLSGIGFFESKVKISMDITVLILKLNSR